MFVNEYAIQSLRRSNLPADVVRLKETETFAETVDKYYFANIANQPGYNPDQEHLFVLILDARDNIRGHSLVSLGTLTMNVSTVRETFRPAIIAAANALIIVHNHPVDDTTPSDADIETSLTMVTASHGLQLPLYDSIIVGRSAGHATSIRKYVDGDPARWLENKEMQRRMAETLGAIFGGGRFPDRKKADAKKATRAPVTPAPEPAPEADTKKETKKERAEQQAEFLHEG